MLQYLRSGDAAFLVDVPDEDDRCTRFLGKFQDGCRTLAHLHDAARRRVDILRRDGLYGVDDHQVGSRILDVRENLLQRRFARNEQVACLGMGDAVGTQLQLPCAFFARNVQHLLVREPEYRLKHQRRLSDARFPAYQRERALYQSAAQYAVQFVVTHVDALLLSRGDFVQPLRFRAYRFDAVRHMLGYGHFLAHHLFHKRVPLPARRTLACPFGRFLSAVGANIYGFFFRHDSLVGLSSYLCKDTKKRAVFLVFGRLSFGFRTARGGNRKRVFRKTTGRFSGFCTKTKIFCTNSARILVRKSVDAAGLKKVNAFLLSMPSSEVSDETSFDYIFVYYI